MPDARAEILTRIAAALRVEPAMAPEAVPAAGFPESGAAPPLDAAPPEDVPQELVERFSAELRAVNGDASLVADAAQLSQAVAAYVRARDFKRIALQEGPLARAAAKDIPSALLPQLGAGRTADLQRIESADCAILQAESLLADTGSALLLLQGFAQRLLAYLPPACVVVAQTRRIFARMSAEALQPAFEAARAGRSAEAVIVTGPSRTADIEKMLVLGAHGPRSLQVFLVADGLGGH
jgi:L-lactate dehydrogenase complex protein LldG